MTLLVTVHVVICLALIGIILLQPGKGDMGIGFGSSSQSIFGSKGASNFLTKTTTIAAAVFLFTSFLITKLRMWESTSSVMDSVPVEQLEKSNTETTTSTESSTEPATGSGAPSAKGSDDKQGGLQPSPEKKQN